MGTLSATLLKWYQCTNWTEAATHGGAIDTGNEITTNTSNNIFDDVSDAERSAGDTDYRKIFFRNENDDTYTTPKAWIDSNTPCTGDAVWVQLGGSKSQQGAAVQLTGTATFTNGATTVYTSSSLVGEVLPGERIYNSTDDAYTLSATIYSVAATVILLDDNYGGTTGDGKDLAVASADTFTYVQPASLEHSDVLIASSIASNGSFGIWIKRVVDAESGGYVDNTFTIKVENT
jgi:hypothetical protein